MTQATVPGYVYTVYTAEGCTVTAPGFPAFSVTCSPGMANSFTAPGDKVEISDPAATLVAVRTFNGALAALGLLGGGKNILPAGYKLLGYLESTGTQYINTGIFASNETEVRAVLKLQPAGGVTRYYRTFGSATATDPRISLTLTVMDSGATFGSRFGSVSRSFNSGLSVADIETSVFEVFVSAAGAGVVGKRQQNNVLDAEWQCAAQTQLFSWDSGGGLKGRVYSFRMLEAGVLRLNFIPALDETGAPCMFDTVSKTAFYNAATGDFVYPYAVSTFARRRVLPDWGKLTPHGLRRLYHVPEGYEGDMLQYAADHGFCPIQEEPQPEEGWWAPKWEEIAGVIYLRWVETAAPEEN